MNAVRIDHFDRRDIATSVNLLWFGRMADMPIKLDWKVDRRLDWRLGPRASSRYRASGLRAAATLNPSGASHVELLVWTYQETGCLEANCDRRRRGARLRSTDGECRISPQRRRCRRDLRRRIARHAADD